MSSSNNPRRPSTDESGSATWISGILSGAGKLISFVFNSNDPSPSPSSSSYISSSDDEDENMHVSSKETYELKQIEKSLEPVKDSHGKSLAIISDIEPKNAIEQLIRQETFSRDEGIKLIKIIQSRVAEVGEDGRHKELIHSNIRTAIASPGIWNSLNKSRKLPDAIPYYSGSPNAVSPSSCQMLAPNLCNSAVMQAKRWLEDKKLVSCSNADFDCQSNFLKYDFGDEEGSPVDMAKSYMQSLPPWRSPSLSNIGFEKASHSGVHLNKDKAPYATSSYSMPSAKGLKRNHPVYGWEETVDENRRVRMKLNDCALTNSNFKLTDSSEKYLGTEGGKDSPETGKLSHPVSSKLLGSESLDASAVISAECSLKDNGGVLGVSNETIVKENHPEKENYSVSPNIILYSQEAANEVQSTLETPSIATLPVRLDCFEVGPQLCDPATLILDGNQVKEHPNSSSDPCDTLTPSATLVEHTGDHSETRMNSESQILPTLTISSSRSDFEVDTSLNDVSTSGMQSRDGIKNNYLHQTLISSAKKIHSVPDLMQQDGNGQIQDDGMQQDRNDQIQDEGKKQDWNGQIQNDGMKQDRNDQIQDDGTKPDWNDQVQDGTIELRISANGSAAELNEKADVAVEEEPNAIISDAVLALPYTRRVKIHGRKTTNGVRGRSGNRGGTKPKPPKDHTSPEPQPPGGNRGGGRGRKAVAVARRGRGR